MLVFVGGCNPKKTDQISDTTESKRVVAASYPLEYLTKRLVAGSDIQVEFPCPDGEDPRVWSPSVSEIQELQKADLVVVNGPGPAYAKWLVRVSLLDSKLCNSAGGFPTKDYIMIPDHQIVHSHGPEGEHSHEYMVPYAWMDPAVASLQAEAISQSLGKTYPESAELFAKNLEGLQKDLTDLAAEFQAASRDDRIVSSNPNAKYLTRSLGLEDKHLLIFDFNDADQLKSAKARVRELGSKPVTAFIVVEEPGTGVTDDQIQAFVGEAFEGTAPKIIRVNLLDFRPKDGDYLTEMRELLKRLQ